MLIEGISNGILTVDEVKYVFNPSTSMYDVELMLSQFYSYGKYLVERCTMHYCETRKCSYLLASYDEIGQFKQSAIDVFLQKNKNAVIFLRRSFDVLDVIDVDEAILLNTRTEENNRLTQANKAINGHFQATHQDSLNFYLDKYVCLNENSGYEFYGMVGRYQHAKSYFSATPKADVDLRKGAGSLSALIIDNSRYLTMNRQRMIRSSVELEDERKGERIRLLTAKHYELTNHFKNVIAAVVLCGNPKNLSENLKKSETYINESNETRVVKLTKDFMTDPIAILDEVRRMGTAYFISPGGRFQDAFESYVNTCFIITSFLFGSVNAGVRVGISHFFDADVSANDVLGVILCNLEYLKCECELLEDLDKKEFLSKSLRSLLEKVMEMYA